MDLEVRHLRLITAIADQGSVTSAANHLNLTQSALSHQLRDIEDRLGASLFLIGFLTYAPDSLISGTAAVDFGTKKGASTASGLINGFGSIGAIVGGTVPGFFQKQWGWQGIFSFLAGATLIAALILLPKWNALPATAPPKN